MQRIARKREQLCMSWKPVFEALDSSNIMFIYINKPHKRIWDVLISNERDECQNLPSVFVLFVFCFWTKIKDYDGDDSFYSRKIFDFCFYFVLNSGYLCKEKSERRNVESVHYDNRISFYICDFRGSGWNSITLPKWRIVWMRRRRSEDIKTG